MIYDDLTERDLYMYRRGEMREYIRNHGILPEQTRHELYEWVQSGHSVHENPWGLYDDLKHMHYDYLAALRLANKQEKN